MDLGRLVAAHCANTLAASENREKFFDCLFNASDWSSVSRGSPLLKPQETNVLLLLRTLANCFQEGSLVNDRWAQQVKKTIFLSALS